MLVLLVLMNSACKHCGYFWNSDMHSISSIRRWPFYQWFVGWKSAHMEDKRTTSSWLGGLTGNGNCCVLHTQWTGSVCVHNSVLWSKSVHLSLYWILTSHWSFPMSNIIYFYKEQCVCSAYSGMSTLGYPRISLVWWTFWAYILA